MADLGADAGARAIGADADGGFAWSGRRRWCRRRSSAASYRVIANDRKFRSTDSGSQCRALSADFPAGARGLYPLARGCRNSTGARDGTRADGVLDPGRRRLFSFSRYCLAAPSSYRVDRGRHPGCRPSVGWLNVELSLPIFRLALAVFIPWRGAAGIRPARGMAPALMVCWIQGGAGFFLFRVIAWRRRRATGSIAAGTRGVDLRWGGSMSSSLCRFSGWRSRSLSLGEGLPEFDRRAGWHPR